MKKSTISLITLIALTVGVIAGSRFAIAKSNIELNAHPVFMVPVGSETQLPETKAIQVSQEKEVIKDSCRRYIEDGAFRAKLNGHKLNLDHKAWLESEFADSDVKALSTGELLVSVGNSLYLLDSKMSLRWKFTVPQFLNDYSAIESTGLIYVTAGDNTMFILELTSGKKLFKDGRNGSAAYGQVESYGEDQCLVLDNYGGYRIKMSESELKDPTWRTSKLMSDGISAWRGTKKLWHRDFPPDAELLVKENKIYAVTKTRTSVYIREIAIPEK